MKPREWWCDRIAENLPRRRCVRARIVPCELFGQQPGLTTTRRRLDGSIGTPSPDSGDADVALGMEEAYVVADGATPDPYPA
jgi:hypothetical protein